MLFTVLRQSSGPSTPFDTPFALHQDKWNDYSFQTQYHLYHRTDGDAAEFIGTVKILRRGQTESDGIQLPLGTFESLDSNFCSVGQSLDYYERLAGVPREQRESALKALRDIVFDPTIRESFRSERGWSISLFREFPENADFLNVAEVLLNRAYHLLPKLDVSISFHPRGWENALEFTFDAPGLPDRGDIWVRSRSGTDELPRRIAVVVGRNGSGKSTLLARFARVAFATPDERSTDQTIREIGSLLPAGLGFTRVITISYSAFDSFQVPGVTRRDRDQIANDLDRGVGRFVFSGLRDITEELRKELQQSEPETAFIGPTDRNAFTLLKPIERLADEFSTLVRNINDQRKLDLLKSALAPILKEASFGEIDAGTMIARLSNDAVGEFMQLSTGHKIVLHVIASIVCHTEPRSIVLFDEPESHLHPPLLAGLMHAVRFVLDQQDAFAIVATHSPVVLQESLARHVRIIRREGDHTQVLVPNMETFGENVGALTYEVFQLTAGATDFHEVLDSLVHNINSLEEIEAVFEKGLSQQARAYVMSRLAEEGGA